MAFKEHKANACKRDKKKYEFDAKPDCRRFYSKETVEALVAEDVLSSNFERYTVHHGGKHSSEHFFVGWIDGKQVAVRGALHAKFLYLHHFMGEEAARSQCAFEESYAFTPGEWQCNAGRRARAMPSFCSKACNAQEIWKVRRIMLPELGCQLSVGPVSLVSASAIPGIAPRCHLQHSKMCFVKFDLSRTTC
jgi:hypothetical protein